MRPDRDTEFAEYMSARMPALRRLARLLCQDWIRADDLLQAAMTKTYVHWSKAARADNTDAYVRAILIREWIEDRRASPASIARAARQGRTRLSRRRSLSIAAPLVAAATVLAIAVSSTLLAPAPARPAQGQSLPRQPHEVPPLFFWPGWLPHGMKVTSGVVSAPHGEWLNVRGVGSALMAFPPGACTLKPSKLACGPLITYALDGSAGEINGFPACWSGGSGLVFELTRGQWATVAFRSREDSLLVVQHLTAHVPPIRYPAQLTGRWAWA